MAHSLRNSILIAAVAAAIAGCTTTPTAPPVVELPAATVTDVISNGGGRDSTSRR
jgi:hypothetical protein